MVWGSTNSDALVQGWVDRIQRGEESLYILSCKPLSSQSAAKLCNAVKQKDCRLKEFHFSGVGASQNQDGVDPIIPMFADMLQQNQSIEKLSLGAASLGDSNLELLVNGILQNEHSPLTSLDLECKSLTAASCTVLSQLISSHRHELKRLVLRRNQITMYGFMKLIQNGMGTNLTYIDLEECGLSDLPGEETVLVTSLPTSKLEQVRIGNNPMSAESWKFMLGWLNSMPSLVHWHAENSNLNDAVLETVFQAHIHRLRSAHLASNAIFNNSSLNVFASLLANADHLTILDLSSCSVQDEFCGMISHLFLEKKLGHLHQLVLRENQISHLGMQQLIHLGNVRHLDLFHNPKLAPHAFHVMASSIQDNYWPLISQLDLGGCNISAFADIEPLLIMLRDGRLHNLVELGLGGNPVCSSAEFQATVDELKLRRPVLKLEFKLSNEQEHECG